MCIRDSYYFRLIALMGFLEEQPQFVGTANATYTVSEGAFIALDVYKRQPTRSINANVFKRPEERTLLAVFFK